MIQTASSTLLFYPEWIIWIAVVLSVANLVITMLVLTVISSRRMDAMEHCRILSDELITLRREHDELRARHHERRDRLSELGVQHEQLKREYDELWKEHQDFATDIGAMLPDEKTPGEVGRGR